MKPRMLWVLLLFSALWGRPAAADNRFIVRAPSGLLSLQQVCLALGCNVSVGLDGSLGKLFLVTTPDLIDPNAFLQTLRSQAGISHVELDALLKVMQAAATVPPSGLSDNTPVYTRLGVGLSPWLRAIVVGAVKFEAMSGMK